MRLEIRGLSYHVERAGSGPPLVVLHGFTGSARAMDLLTEPLRAHYDVVAIDLPGHGGTFCRAPAERFAMDAVVADLAELVRRLELGRAAWFGYSLGGRTVLALAVARPDLVGASIVLGASPGIDDDAERAARCRADDELAARIERDGVAAFVEEWERLPLFASQQRLAPERRARQRATRLSNDPTGLAASLRGMGAGAQRPLHDRLAGLEAPLLVLAGADDAKYCRLGEQLAQALPRAVFQPIARAGHAAHLEAPDAVVEAVEAFLAPSLSHPVARGVE